MKLIYTKIVCPTAPFDFDSTFHKPDHFTSGDNLWEPGVRWQTWTWRDECLGIRFKDCGIRQDPKIEVNIFFKKEQDQDFIDSLIDEIEYRYNLKLDLKPFYKEFENEKVLGQVIQKWSGMRPGHPSSLYEYLLIGIVLQNATVRRSVQMFKALLENYGTLLEFDGKKLWSFFKPGRLQEASVT